MIAVTIISLIILIALILIVIIIIKKNSKLVNVKPANSQQTISASSLGTTTGTTNNCTYSIWIFVNDWSVNYGDEKVIFQRSYDTTSPPGLSVELGNYETNLIVKTQVLSNKPESSSYFETNRFVCNGGGTGSANFSCDGSYNNTPVTLSNAKSLCNQTNTCVGYQWDERWDNNANLVNVSQPGIIPNFIPVSYENSGETGFYMERIIRTHKTCVVPNFEIQKWTNIILSADTNSMDIYIDGVLIQSCDLEGEININNAYNVYLSPGGKGFNGWNSRFQYWPKYINPRQAMNIYRKGSGSHNLGVLNYKLKVSLNDGNNEMVSANI
jgi:hypothetical protein